MWGNPEDDEEYVTRDSGEKAVHSDGVQRDTQNGKTLFTLLFPKGVPMAQQLMVRVAKLYTRGAEKYGDRNWENSRSADTLAHHEDALWRHFMNFYFGIQDGEDHAAAIVWNINAVELNRRNLQGSEVKQEITPENITDEQADAAFKAAAKAYGQPQSESDIAFHNVRRACQENFKTAEPTDRNPNDHRYH
jgi:hypothetical protein